MKKYIIIAIIALLAFTAIGKDRDIVYLIGGAEVVGALIEITDSHVILETGDGKQTFPVDTVRSIDLGTWRPGDDWENRLDIDDSILEKALEDADMASREYTAAGYITLFEKGVLTVNADNSADYVLRHIYYIANERGKDKANYSMGYFADNQSVSVNFARSVGLASISTVADNAIEDGSVNAWVAEYQRKRRKKFALTGASLGSVVDYQLTKHYDNIDVFTGLNYNWNFYDKEPILESVFEVRSHKSVPLKFHEVEVDKPIKTIDGDYVVRTWRMENIEPYIQETMLPNLSWFMPNVVVSLPQNLQELSAAYYDKVEIAMDALDLVEKRLAENFPAGKPSIEDVYNYVSENFTSNWVGMGEYYPYPKPLSELLELSRIARYELPFILYAFLTSAGYNPELILVGPGEDSKIPPDMLNINYFNAVRVRIKDGTEIRYLSPNEYLRYDHQNLDACYILPVRKGGAKIEKLPRLPGNDHYTVPVYECKLLPNGTLEMHFTEQYFGETGGDGYRYYKNRKPREVDNSFDSRAKDIDQLANIESYELTGYKDLSDKVQVSYSVEIPGYAVGAGEEILAFKLPTVGFSASQVGAAERTLPFSSSGNNYSEKIITIELPEGYEIEYLPENVSFSVGYRSFNAEIEVEDGVLTYEETATGKHTPMISQKKYSAYKSFVEKKAKFSDNWILLRKSS